MISFINRLFNLSFTNAGQWFASILSKSGVASIYLGCLFAWLIYKFILSPVFGVAISSGASDTVKKIKRKNVKTKKTP